MDVSELEKYGIEGSTEGKLIIDLHTRWCGPCMILSPTLEGLRDEGLVNLIQVDLDENRAIGQDFNIFSVPTLLFFKDGRLLTEDINIDGRTVVNKGIMIGAAGELVLREIIEKM